MLSPIELLEERKLYVQSIINSYNLNPKMKRYYHKQALIDYVEELQQAIDWLKQKGGVR